MVNLKVDNKRYSITSNPTIDQWMDLMRYDFEAQPHWIHIIKRITDLPVSVIEEMTFEQQHLAVTMIAHTLTLRQRVELPDFNQVTFGQFIDMEYYIAMGTHKCMHQILDTLAVQTEGTQQALYVTEEYIKWRDNIYKQYKALFGLDDPTEQDLIESKPRSATEVAKDWYRVLVDLANDDVLKINEVTERGVKEIFNFMAVRKERQLEELNRLKQQKLRNDLQTTRR